MRKRGLIFVTAVLSLLPAMPAELYAQDGFMLGRPKAQLTLRAGPVLHRAGGDLFNFFQSELTLDRSDFRAPALGGDFSFAVHPRLDIAVGASWSSLEKRSASFDTSCVGTEYECTFVDAVTEQPVQQVTKLRVIPILASVRFYPLARGYAISELAWIPARTTPYIGGGGGFASYRLEQAGDFVSTDDLSIFTAAFASSGTTPIGHVLAGVDHWFSPRFGLNAEGRYTFGSAAGSHDFVTWDSIDLSGLHMGIGLSLRW